jgi:peptide deformylase
MKIPDTIPINPPSIYQKSTDFDFSRPEFDSIQFAKDLVECMMKHNGLGLAAPQIGINKRILAIRANPMIVMFNPKIVDTSEELIKLEEGCLSFPEVFLKISRPRFIRVRYTQPNGNIVTEKYGDITARVVQHEIDHLDGITMVDHVHAIHREKVQRKLKQVRRKLSS